MSDRDFEIGTKNFKLLKLDAFKQFHIVRKISPLLADLLPAMKDMQKTQSQVGLSESEKFDQFAEIAAPILKGLSKLSDEDSNKVLMTLLSGAEMQGPGGVWIKIVKNDSLMVQDLDLKTMLQVAGRVFMFNLSDFFVVLPQVS